MRMRLLSAASAAVLLVTLAGCGGGDDGGSSDDASDPPETSASSTEPTTPETTPEPKPLTEAELKAALVTVDELGKPWFEPESVTTQQNGNEGICPGKPVPGFAGQYADEATRSLTKGQEPTADIVSFRASTIKPDAIAGWESLREAELTRCKEYESNEGTYVQVEFPVDMGSAASSLDGGIGYVERVYSDPQHTDLLYVRHSFGGCIGSTSVRASLAFLTDKSDPQGKDLSETQQLFQMQVDKLLEQTG